MAPSNIQDHGSFGIWSYRGPSKKARGFWHGDNPLDCTLWAFALRDKSGTFWETAKAKGGFQSEEEAKKAAIAALAKRAN